MAPDQLLIAAALRPHPTETVSGDAWTIDWQANGCRIAVIDGLGHGPGAASAALRAREALAAAPDLGPAEAIRLSHEALHDTRGAVIGITAIDVLTGRLSFAGVGNIEGRLISAGGTQRLSSARGIVGAMLPTIRPVELALPPEWTLVIHSDGISERFDPAQIERFDSLDVQSVADAILTRWGRATDDASVVVVRP
jgi:serine phosphatase RsbU (regulator of sigma subunit)